MGFFCLGSYNEFCPLGLRDKLGCGPYSKSHMPRKCSFHSVKSNRGQAKFGAKWTPKITVNVTLDISIAAPRRSTTRVRLTSFWFFAISEGPKRWLREDFEDKNEEAFYAWLTEKAEAQESATWPFLKLSVALSAKKERPENSRAQPLLAFELECYINCYVGCPFCTKFGLASIGFCAVK